MKSRCIIVLYSGFFRGWEENFFSLSCNTSTSVRVEGNSFSLSAAPSRGSRVPQDPCSRGIFCGRGIIIPKRYPCGTIPRLPRGGRVGRVLSRAAGARLRELPSAAAGLGRCSQTGGYAPKKISHPKPTSPSAFPQSFPKEGLQNVSGPRCR